MSLSVDYTSLRQAVGRMLGLNATITSWTAAQADEVDDIIASGLRKFYWPKLADGSPQHEWTFLRKSGTLTMVVGTSAYDLPTDFASLVGEPVLQSAGGGRLERISVEDMLAMQAKRDIDATPVFCAVRPKAYDITQGTVYEFLTYPTPIVADTVAYRYVCEPVMLTDINPYPYGGVVHGETIQAAVLAAVEQLRGDYAGVNGQQFMEQLAASIRIDQGQRP